MAIVTVDEGLNEEENVFDLEKHGKIVRELAEKFSPIKGDIWYVISNDWWKVWKSYVENVSGGQSSTASEPESPGPIDNSSIIDENKNLSKAILRPNLIESLDYVLLPEEAWNEIKARYGLKDNEQEIPRDVIESGLFHKTVRVEVYPLELNICCVDGENDKMPIVLSRTSTLENLRKIAKEKLKIDENDIERVRLYLEHKLDDDTNDVKYEYLDFVKHGKTSALEDLVSPGALVIVDVLNAEGKGKIDLTKLSSQTSSSSSSTKAVIPSTFGTSAPVNGSTVRNPASISRMRRFFWLLFESGALFTCALYALPASATCSTFANVYTYLTDLWHQLTAGILYWIGCDSSSYRYTRIGTTSYSNYFDDNDKPGTYSAGLCGLQNLGNTCFMNSALQCLSNTPDLTEYFASGQYQGEINDKNPLGMHGRLAKAYGNLVKNMWSGSHRSYLPRDLKVVVGQFAPTFSGYQQQDSQELMAFVLDGLHEDLNRIKNKPYIEEKETEGRPDKVIATESWENYKLRNDSVIVDLFHGQLKSTLVCPVCSKVSIKFDPFCYLSLPLPSRDKGKAIVVTFVPLDLTDAWMKYQVYIPKFGRVSDLLEAVAEIAGVSSEQLTMAGSCGGRLSPLLRNNEFTTRMGGASENIYIWQLPDIPDEEDPVIVWGVQRIVHSPGALMAQRFLGAPICLRMRQDDLTVNSIREQMKNRLHRTFAQLPENETKWWLEEGEEAADDSGVEENGDSKDGMKNEDRDTPMDTSEDKNEDESSESTSTEENRPIFKLSFSATFTAGAAAKSPPNTNACHSHATNFDDPVVYAFVDWDKEACEKFFMDEFEQNIETDDSMSPVRKKNNIQLAECLDLFTKEEKLGENDPWFCPGCKDFRQATKKLELWKLPDMLIVHLKRFQYSRWYRDKIESIVEFPIRKLDLMKWIIDPDHPDQIYDLVAVSNHMGGLGGGHYTAYAMNKNDKRWYSFDDSHVSPLTRGSEEPSIISRNAYVLFYKRRHHPDTQIDPNIQMEDMSD